MLTSPWNHIEVWTAERGTLIGRMRQTEDNLTALYMNISYLLFVIPYQSPSHVCHNLKMIPEEGKHNKRQNVDFVSYEVVCQTISHTYVREERPHQR